MLVEFFFFIDQSLSMNEYLPVGEGGNQTQRVRKWDKLSETVITHTCCIREQYQDRQDMAETINIYFYKSHDCDINYQSSSISFYDREEYNNSNISKQLKPAFNTNHPKGASYIGPILRNILVPWLDKCKSNLEKQACVILYTDCQLADRIDFAYLLSDFSRRLNGQTRRLKILMVGIGINDSSLVDPTFYLNLAADQDRFKHGTDSNIFGFDLLEEIERLPNGIIEFLERHFKIDPKDRLPKIDPKERLPLWVQNRYPEWYRQQFGS